MFHFECMVQVPFLVGSWQINSETSNLFESNHHYLEIQPDCSKGLIKMIFIESPKEKFGLKFEGTLLPSFSHTVCLPLVDHAYVMILEKTYKMAHSLGPHFQLGQACLISWRSSPN